MITCKLRAGDNTMSALFGRSTNSFDCLVPMTIHVRLGFKPKSGVCNERFWCPHFHCNGKIIFKNFFAWNSAPLHSGPTGLCPPHCYATGCMHTVIPLSVLRFCRLSNKRQTKIIIIIIICTKKYNSKQDNNQTDQNCQQTMPINL